MGNRCSRWIARTAAHESTRLIAFPISARFIEPYLDQHSRPVIVTMGFIRAVLPFMFSFIGSAIGRQLTFNTCKLCLRENFRNPRCPSLSSLLSQTMTLDKYANFRWKPVQNVMNFNQDAGVYQDTILDGELQALAHEVAVAIGQGKDPVETRSKMAALGFQMVGSGHGGYAVYRRRELDMAKAFFVHITPYGPSILDEIPRYIVLERKKIFHTGKVGWEEADANILDAAIPPLASIYGFTYSGAFFKSQEWAALTDRFESTLMEYKKACSRLGNQIYTPPTDLQTLKNFIRSGHEPKKKRKDKKRWKEINQEVQVLSKLVAKCQQAGKAPKRVILYLEGLDCSAKSSTGGLICQALQDCGYAVRLAQHNRPPTPEQRAKSWMDRGRFEYPEDVYECDEEVPEYTALIWDRGPAGDFVYGKFAELDMEAKMEKYAEFREYDEICKEEGVLFCKLLFVADKDSIASTLGKRLAHKKIVKDLHTWLDANSVEQAREGLEEIEMHIDPTDFIAFNNYKTNLSIFTSFARNTNKVGYQNPWTVVNTCKRHPTRLMLLKTFEKQLKNFAKEPPGSETTTYRLADLLKQKSIHDGVIRPVPANYVEERQQGLSLRAIFQSMLLVALLYFYAYITWKFDIQEYA